MGQRLAAFVAAILIVAACGSSQTSPSPAVVSPQASTVAAATSPSPSAPVSSSPTTTPAATPSPTVAPTRSPTPAPKWKTYTSRRNDYRIKYPPTWIVTPGNAKLADTIDDFRHFIYISRDTVSGRVSLDLTQTGETNYLKSHYHARLLSKTSLTVAGWPARLLTFNAVRDGRKLYIQELILARGQVAYFLAWWSDRGNASADRRLFKSIYRTFRPT